jgi:hypothetical protein
MPAKGPEPEYVTFVGQFSDRQLSGTPTTAFGRCSGSREIEGRPDRQTEPPIQAREEEDPVTKPPPQPV